jgi:hypothetical protein
MASHKLKDRIGKTIKLYQFNSTPKKVNTESVIRNTNSFFMITRLLDLAILLKTENQIAVSDSLLASI